MNITFDRYHKYDEIRAFLQDCVREYPNLCRVECIGKSYQDREILMLEITNHATGPGADKPGVYTDGNTHAGEITGCEVILYTIKQMLEAYGSDPKVTALIDTRVFYFIPRITVDGSEYYLTTPCLVRSSLHPWPVEEDQKPGLYADDIDGDGRILQMRVKNPDGNWKVSKKDARLMVKRRPDEMGSAGYAAGAAQGAAAETYYDVYTEGFIRDYDPDLPVASVPSRNRLDFNRQYPANWLLPVKQAGSGDYPFSEPEMKAVGDFYLAHPNIATAMAYHTSGGIQLRAPANKGDREMDQRDLALFEALGDIAQEYNGYPMKSVYEAFATGPSDAPVGSDLEWDYETLGILSFETELWDMQGRAGVQKRFGPQWRNMSEKDREEDGVKLLRWQDEKLEGKLFVDWHPFSHPQLGEVEIGGWEPKMGRQNPPVSLLEEECRNNSEFTLARAAASPHLVIEKATVEALADGVYKIEAVIKNEGYLATNVTYNAIKMRQAKPVKVALLGVGAAGVPKGGASGETRQAHIIAGKAEQEIGHLGGRAGGGDHKQKVTWAVRAAKGANLTIEAFTPRAGKAKAEVALQ